MALDVLFKNKNTFLFLYLICILLNQQSFCLTLYIDQITFYHFFLHSTDIMYRHTVKHYHDFVNTTLHLNKPSLLLDYTHYNSWKGRNIQRLKL